jgi:hypothetical protein
MFLGRSIDDLRRAEPFAVWTATRSVYDEPAEVRVRAGHLHQDAHPLLAMMRRALQLVSVALVACGGATSQDPFGSDASAGSDAGADAAGDVAFAVDAPVDARIDGQNPRRVSCGAVECSREGDGRGREVCCVTPGTPPQMKCTRELEPSACDQGTRQCDDTADCSGGEVCCAETSDDGKMSTRCLPTCITGAERWQVCKTDAECEGNIPCTTGICPRQGVFGFCVGAAVPRGCR